MSSEIVALEGDPAATVGAFKDKGSTVLTVLGGEVQTQNCHKCHMTKLWAMSHSPNEDNEH